MKKLIAAALLAGASVTGFVVSTGVAQATPYCATGLYDFGTGTCITGPGCGSSCNPDLVGAGTPSRQINGCDTRVGAPVEANLKCWGDGWE